MTSSSRKTKSSQIVESMWWFWTSRVLRGHSTGLVEAPRVCGGSMLSGLAQVRSMSFSLTLPRSRILREACCRLISTTGIAVTSVTSVSSPHRGRQAGRRGQVAREAVGERRGASGLASTSRAGAQAVGGDGARVAGHQHDRQVGADACSAAASSVPVISGMTSSVSTRSNRSGSARNAASAARLAVEADRLVAERGQHLLAEQHQRRLVVDQQHGLAVAPGAAAPASSGSASRRAPRVCGQIGLEGAARAGAALHVQRAAVVGDDAVHRGQAEAGAAARRLGREERLEDPLQRCAASMPWPVSRTARRT